LSLIVDDPNIQPLEPTGAVVGIDMGVADLAITSDGYKYPKFEANWYEQQVIESSITLF
jgi:putative transposase